MVPNGSRAEQTHGMLNRTRLTVRKTLTKIPRRSIAFVLKTVWGNSAHREALKKETGCASILPRLLTLVLRPLKEYRQVCSIRQPHDQ